MLAADGLELCPGAGCHRIRAHALRSERTDAAARQHELDAVGIVADVAAVRVPDARRVSSGSQSQSVYPPVAVQQT
jgi:hypothetical protein